MRPDAVYELRNYVMKPGRRDDLIAIFEHYFIESQETLGSHVAATFRNLDDPDRFVWVRSFADMPTRAVALDGFYTSPLWRELRNQVNDTMTNTDNVLLLRPAWGRLVSDRATRPPIGAVPAPNTLIVATTYFTTPHDEATFADVHAREIAPRLRHADVDVLASFLTEHAANSYPRLPVREHDTVFVCFTRFANLAAYEAAKARLAAGDWAQAHAALERRTIASTEIMRLAPTARSLLR